MLIKEEHNPNLQESQNNNMIQEDEPKFTDNFVSPPQSLPPKDENGFQPNNTKNPLKRGKTISLPPSLKDYKDFKLDQNVFGRGLYNLILLTVMMKFHFLRKFALSIIRIGTSASK